MADMRQVAPDVFLGHGARQGTWDVAVQRTAQPLAAVEEHFSPWPEIFELLDEHAIAVATIMALSSVKGAAAFARIMNHMAASVDDTAVANHSAYLTAAVGDYNLAAFEPWSRWGHSASRTATGPGVRRSTWYDGNQGWWRPPERDWHREFATVMSKGKNQQGKGKMAAPVSQPAAAVDQTTTAPPPLWR